MPFPRSFSFSLLLVFCGFSVAADLPTEKSHTNSVGIKLVRVEPGSFQMGMGEQPPTTREEWDQRDWDESPVHTVKITKPFYLGATEITNAQYEQFDPEHKKLRGKFGQTSEDNDPVNQVSWQQAVAFCQWLSKKEGLPYRLPTEAEWEYACRAGTATKFNTGDTITPEQANLGGWTKGPGSNWKGPKQVGSYPANAWGLFDMHGNVAEWCHDWYGAYEPGEQSDPVGRADGDARIARGWSTARADHKMGSSRYTRCSNRSGHLPEDANKYTGFRVVLGEMPATKPLPVIVPPNQQNVKPEVIGDGRTPRDPAVPFYFNYANERDPQITRIPKTVWGPIYGAWNHFTGITACPNGDILAVWYSTVSESGRECSQAAIRLRAGGSKWDEPSLFFTVPDCNAHAPVLLSDGKRLYHFFTQSLAGWDDAADCLRTSDDNGATWSKARIIVKRENPRRMSQPCTAFVAKNGTIVLAADGDAGHKDERVIISRDRGETWEVRGGDMKKTAGKYAIHPAVVQRDDGAYLAFLRGPDPMAVMISKDEGDSWELVPSDLPGIGVGQKTAAMKLASGGLFLASFDTRKQFFDGGTYVALSFDDGKTWPHAQKLDPAKSPPGGYMSVAQAKDGTIYLFGSGPRCIAFNEAWLKTGKPFPEKKVEVKKEEPKKVEVKMEEPKQEKQVVK